MTTRASASSPIHSRPWLTPLLICCLLVTLVGAAAVGPTGLRAPWLFDDTVLGLRWPRVGLAALVGASLALAGLSMQALVQNDLADPYILGLSGGASVGAVTSLVLWPGLPPGGAAALGAGAAAAIVRALSRGAYDPTRLLLAGFAVGTLLSSATGLLLVLAPADRLLRSATYWLFGGLGTPSWLTLGVPSAALLVLAPWLQMSAARLDRLTLGEDVATSLGVDVVRLRRGILLASVALTASAVAAAGLIGFVGLVAPHAARRWVGPGHRRLIPAAALIGAWLVSAADAVSRTAFAPREVPVGLITAAIGGPLFLWQLQRGNP